jgi:hypothetical protein
MLMQIVKIVWAAVAHSKHTLELCNGATEKRSSAVSVSIPTPYLKNWICY